MLKRLTTPCTVRAMLMALLALAFLRPLSAQSYAAKLQAMMGQVSLVQSSNSSPSSAKALFVGGEIQPRQMVLTGPNSYAKFLLADGSFFEVFENSKVVFHDDFGWTYLLNIILGHIRVFIDHSKGPNSNSVTTPTAVISVRGTIFDIVVQDEDTTMVTLEEGWVHVRNSTIPGGFEPDLRQKGDSVTVVRGQGLMGRQVDHSGGLLKALRIADDVIRVLAQQRPGGVPIGGVGGGSGGIGGVSGAQGDKGKGGAAPPPAPPATSSGH
jgi:ferric-dicitrate binding protein FerR (iron transport regulator)